MRGVGRLLIFGSFVGIMTEVEATTPIRDTYLNKKKGLASVVLYSDTFWKHVRVQDYSPGENAIPNG
jgi:hypothetical protein